MFKTYLDKGLSFDDYLKTIKKTAEIFEKKYEIEMEKKHVASYQRMVRIMENYIPDIEQEERFRNKGFNGSLLIIAEAWCGDCSQSIPVINKFFHGKNHIKILYRDENPDLISQFLTNGNKAVPIVIFLDEENRSIVHWGPRTKYGTQLLLQHKTDPEHFSKEAFLSELHNYYDHNKGKDIIEEILSLLSINAS